MSESNITIVGAGLAGLIAANILRRHSPLVLERQSALPHNHSAVLRFRTPAVSNATGVPFQRVLVHKGIWDGERVLNETTIPLANQYSANVTSGSYGERSVWNLGTEERFLAPRNFPELIAPARVLFDTELKPNWIGSAPVVSTLPMPVLANMLGYRDNHIQSFRWQPIWTIRLQLPDLVNLNQTVYNGSRNDWWYRATIEGRTFIVECAKDQEELVFGDAVQDILWNIFGLEVPNPSKDTMAFHKQEYGKLLPIPEDFRKEFIRWATEKHNVFSLGRFATWRQGLLLDDIVKDTEIIDRLAFSSNNRSYDSALK